MIRSNKTLKDFKRGWLFGDFKNSLFKIKEIEIAVQSYRKGDKEKPHYHKEAIEYNLVLNGVVKFNNELFFEGEICIIEKEEISNFEALEDAKVLVIKKPSVIGDKYIV